MTRLKTFAVAALAATTLAGGSLAAASSADAAWQDECNKAKVAASSLFRRANQASAEGRFNDAVEYSGRRDCSCRPTASARGFPERPFGPKVIALRLVV